MKDSLPQLLAEYDLSQILAEVAELAKDRLALPGPMGSLTSTDIFNELTSLSARTANAEGMHRLVSRTQLTHDELEELCSRLSNGPGSA